MLKIFGRIFFVNLFTIGICGIAFLLSSLIPNNIFLRLFESLMILMIIFPLTGLNLTLILEKLANQHFDLFERLTITALFSITLPPLLLLGEFSLLHTLSPLLPFLNTALIFLLTIILCPFGLEKEIMQNSPPLKKYLPSFIFAVLILLFIIVATVGAYYPLPESDPYYWLTKIQHEITTGIFPTGEAYRPLVSYLVYLFTVTAHVDLYAFFKYIFPCFLLLTIFPASLIARRLPRTFDQLAFFLLPLSSASIITYFLFPIPQALVNLILTFFIFLSLHSLFTKNIFFYFLSGITLLVGYLYHDILLLFFFPWLLITLLFWRNRIWKDSLRHKLLTFFILLSTIPHLHNLIPIFNFFKNWLARILSTVGNLESNFSFPLSYVNIDGRAAGWGDWFGATKYYLFYGGPLLFITIALFFFITFSPNQRKRFLQTYLCRWEIIPLFTLFLFFFSIAEIFPRLLNIALLPERALGFAGLLSIGIVPLAYPFIPLRHKSYLIWILFIAIAINISGALYINSLKKDLFSPMKITSMQWIKNALPENRVLVVQNNLAIIKTFSQTESILEIPHRDLYTDITVFNQLLERLSNPILSIFHTTYREYLNQSNKQFDHLQSLDPRIFQDLPDIKNELENLTKSTSNLLQQFPSDTLKREVIQPKNIYIYYAQQEGENLYTSRPYYQKEPTVHTFVFDSDERFEKIYNDQEHQIFIWKYNP